MSDLSAVTLVTAIWGAVTGTAALVWGVWQFVLSGPRVSTEIEPGRIGSILVTGGPVWQRPDPAYPNPVVVVTARNTGRSPVTITRVGVRVEGGVTLHPMVFLGDSPSLPHRLEAGSHASWVIEADAVFAAVKASREVLKAGQTVHAAVDLATGKNVRSRRPLSVPDTDPR